MNDIKHIKLSCSKCGDSRYFYGKTADEIIKKIDASGWVDSPDEDLCPTCFNTDAIEGVGE